MTKRMQRGHIFSTSGDIFAVEPFMPIAQEIQQRTKEFVIQELARLLPNLLALYAFGSRIQGTANAQSDLDLAVLVEGYADPIQLFEMANQLADQLGYEVDLLDMRAASTIMQYQILTTGERWWLKDPLQVGLFEAMVLSEKTNMDEARSGLLADIQVRGKVYG